MIILVCNQVDGLQDGKASKETQSGKAKIRRTPTLHPSSMVSRTSSKKSTSFIPTTQPLLKPPRSPLKEKSIWKVSKPSEKTWMPKILLSFQLSESRHMHKCQVTLTFHIVKTKPFLEAMDVFGGQTLIQDQSKERLFKLILMNSKRMWLLI